MKISLIQQNVNDDKAKNLARVEHLMLHAVRRDQPQLIILPEMFDFAGGDKAQKYAAAEVMGQGQAFLMLQAFAKQHQLYIHAGSFHEFLPQQHKLSNTTVVFNPKGEVIATYRKLHLFDITTPDGTQYFESAEIIAGQDVAIYRIGALTFGCGICYDLRFPELFQALRLRGADILVLPAAFTKITGQAHWEVLLRARAIETQCFVLAAAQTGAFQYKDEERFTYGHSLAIDPWGRVLAELGDEEGFITVEIDQKHLHQVRQSMPIIQHRRFEAPSLK